MAELNYLDHCLIIVGDGGLNDERLARRRLRAGGRLTHILILEDDQVQFMGEEPEVLFSWQPLRGASSKLGKRLGPSMETLQTKSGPDCVQLEPQQHLEIFTLKHRMRLVRLVDQQRILMEMCGEVVLKPNEELSETMNVDVSDPDLKAFGTYSRPCVLRCLTAIFLWKVIQFWASIKFEETGEEVAWWRGTLMLVNGLGFCAWGLWKNCAMSLSGERDLAPCQKVLCCLCVGPTVMAITLAGVAQLPATILGGGIFFLTGPAIQYYLTQAKYPARRFSACMLWALANIGSTIGVGAILCVIVVVYTLLLAAGQPIAASFFLPITTAWTEAFMVIYTRIVYLKLVVERRPAVPGDVSYVAVPFMLTSAHGLSEGARLMGIFAGAVTQGGYSWLGSVALTFLLNVTARTGWLRLSGFYALKRTVGIRIALACAPTAFSKLHDEAKIYVGYFRFITILAMIVARAIAHQDLDSSSSLSAFFNESAALALLCMLVLEVLEDYIVVQQVVPTSPIVAEFIDYDLQKKTRHTSLLSADIRLGPAVSETWRLQELDEVGFKTSKRGGEASLNMSSVLPATEDGPAKIDPPSEPAVSAGAKHVCEVEARPNVFGASVLNLHQSRYSEGQSQQVPSLGMRRHSLPSRVRRWFGQERAVESSLLLHGLREMPWDCQLAAIASIAEMTSGFLDTALGPGYIRGVVPELCKTLSLKQAFLWTSPLSC